MHLEDPIVGVYVCAEEEDLISVTFCISNLAIIVDLNNH